MAKMGKIKQEIGIRFGAMADPLTTQLRAQGRKIDTTEVVLLQKLADAVTLLTLKSILTESESKKARDRIFKKIISHVNKFNKKK